MTDVELGSVAEAMQFSGGQYALMADSNIRFASRCRARRFVPFGLSAVYQRAGAGLSIVSGRS